MIGASSGVISTTALEESKRRGTSDLDAYQCVLRAHEFYRKYLNPEKHLEVRACLERAVEIDPLYADAWAWLAMMYKEEYELGYNPRPNPLDRMEQAARKAISLESSNQQAHNVLAQALFQRKDRDEFLVQAERAVGLNPNDPFTLATQGYQIAWSGSWERGIALVRKAIALIPEPEGWMYIPLSTDYYRRGKYEAALKEALKVNLPFFWTYVHLAMNYAQFGREAEAKAAAAKLLELYPEFETHARTELKKWWWEESMREHMIEGLRKAGLDIPPPD